MHPTVPASPRRRPRFTKRFHALGALALVAGSLSAATITVDSDSDQDLDDALCTLREAIVAANVDSAYHGCGAGSGADTVEFELGPGATIVGSVVGLPTITSSITLAGPGAEELTIDGADLQPLFLVDSPSGGAVFRAHDLTLTRGNAFSVAFGRGGAVTLRDGDVGVFRRVVFRENYSELAGGAIVAVGEEDAPALVTIEDCFFDGNEGGLSGGAIFARQAVLDVRRSTFAFNVTPGEPANGEAAGGGAIHSRDSLLTVRTSTFSGNSTRGAAGGILADCLEPTVPTSLLLGDSTVTGNVGDSDGDDLGNIGGIAISCFPGDDVTVEMQNNLVFGNVDLGAVVFSDLHVFGAGVVSHGFNLLGRNPGMETWFPAGQPNANLDYTGTDASPLTAQISPLEDAGGPTPVHLPVVAPGNLALDHGDCLFDGRDQRGWGDPETGERAVDVPSVPNGPGSDGCDIGAAEAGAAELLELPFADGFEDGTTRRWTSSIEN